MLESLGIGKEHLLPDGGPFLAMKLIRGETLDALLRARYAGRADDRGRFVALLLK